MIDVFSRAVVGWQFASHMRTDYTQELTDHGVFASVGSVGDAYDNAMGESLGDIPPAEFEALHAAEAAEMGADPGDPSPAASAPRVAGGLPRARLLTTELSEPAIRAATASTAPGPPGSTRPTGSLRRAAANPTTLIVETDEFN